MGARGAVNSQAAAERRLAEAELRALVAKFAPDHQRLVSAIRRIIRTRLPTAHEIAYEYRSWFVFSYSPSERGFEGVLAIRGNSDGVKLYFSHGKDLPDPEKLLRGSAQARWIDVGSASVLKGPPVSRLIDEALARNHIPFAPSGGGVFMHSPPANKRRR